MPVLETILGANLGELVKQVVGAFKLSPQAKLEFDQQLAENSFKLQQLQLDFEARLADIASKNLTTEASAGDKFTTRARPTFLYVCNFIIFWNYVVVPIFKQSPVELPEPLFWLFGSVMLGYVGARTWEKIYNKPSA